MAKLISSACDACRQRKVKCCGTKPQCSNCKSSDIPCKYDMPRRKRGPKPRDHAAVRAGSGPPHGMATSMTTPMEGLFVRTGDRDESHDPGSDINSLTPAPAPASTPASTQTQTQPQTQALAPAPTPSPALALARLGRDEVDAEGSTVETLHPRLPSIRADPIFSQLPSIHYRHDFGHAHRIAPWGPSPSSPRDPRPDDRLPSPTEIQRTLAHALDKLGLTAETVATQSIETATSLLFGIVPIYHATSLTASIGLLSQPSLVSLRSLGVMTPMTPYHARLLDDLRAFTLLTSFCAAICANANSNMLASCDDSSIVRIFLRAARDMSLHFEDLDYEHPTSSSLIIKLMQSTAFHCLGKTHMSLCVMGDAYRLLLLMRLFDEQVVNRFPPAEAQALRNIYWSLHMIDKSASVLNDAPSMIHDLCLNQPTTLTLEGPEGFNLLDSSRSPFTSPYEAQLHQGFYVTVRLFAEAGDIFLDLRILARMRARCQGTADSVLDTPSASMMSAYMSFSGILDTLPRWLRDPNSHVVEGDEAATAFQRKAFWTQRANFLVTFHCLRMVILRRAAKLNFCRMLGLIDDESVVALRKTDIAHDMVSAATSVPFEALKINGEYCVEKIRQVGLDLLEIQHKNYDSAISTRAKAIFNHLLDLIARLDSKVSNELAGDLMA